MTFYLFDRVTKELCFMIQLVDESEKYVINFLIKVSIHEVHCSFQYLNDILCSL